MIGWLQSIDAGTFRFINGSLSNPIFDRLMPFLSDSPLFPCFFLALMLVLAWKGGARGRICALMLFVSLVLGNGWICDTLKRALARPRPFVTLPDVIMRVGKGGNYSLPSSHAANWFSAMLVLLVYYRRSVWIMLPMAVLVSFSRIYNGAHYPSDVLAGAVLGAGCSAAILWMLDALWQWLGPRWFPLWRARLPSLLQPVARPDTGGNQAVRDAQWLRLGYLLTAVLLLVRLVYLASGRIELSEDEAYQWLWSKHPALSYYSKPPLIAYTQFLGTHIWGDNEFGVRFFSPIITAILSVLVLRFMTRLAGGRTAFVLLLAVCACPLLDLGAIVMTPDPLSVPFWTAAMIVGWQAAGPSGTTRQWLWTGLWIGLGFLGKYTNLAQFACWAIFFLLWAPARAHLRRPGPWLAIGVVALCSLPVLIWNAQRGWITVAHVASDAQIGDKWTRSFAGEFLMVEAGVLNPIFFVGALWAAIGFWRGGRRDPSQLYLFSMGTPLFFFFFLWSWHSRVLANWPVPAVVPMFCLMAVYWASRWKSWAAILKPCLSIGVAGGVFAVVLAHDPQLLNKLIHRQLPAQLDVLRRVHGWKETARIVGQARNQLEAQGKPAFIIGDHYGMTSLIAFYLPEAKSRVQTDPLVFFRFEPKPDTQFYFWPNYLGRTGQNAIFVREAERLRLQSGWFSRWWHHQPILYANETPALPPPPAEIQREFESVTDLGVKNVTVDGEIVRRIQLFECHNLRGPGMP